MSHPTHPTHPDSTALRLSLEIQAELTALESAKEQGNWQNVRASAQAIDQFAALLEAEKRMDEAGVVLRELIMPKMNPAYPDHLLEAALIPPGLKKEKP